MAESLQCMQYISGMYKVYSVERSLYKAIHSLLHGHQQDAQELYGYFMDQFTSYLSAL